MKRLEKTSRNELIEIYEKSVESIKDAKVFINKIWTLTDDFFNEFYRPIIIEAIKKNCYIDFEYDTTPGILDKINYIVLIDKKTKEIIKKFPY